MTTSEPREFTITRMFDAPRDVVFRAWTDPAHAACWFGPQGFPFWGRDGGPKTGGAIRRKPVSGPPARPSFCASDEPVVPVARDPSAQREEHRR
jgi:hypothetical protein